MNCNISKQLSNKTGGKNLSPMLLIRKPGGSEKNWIIKMTTKVQSWTFSLSQCFSWGRLYLVMLHETKFSFCHSNVLFLDEKQAIPTFHMSWIVRSLQENLPPGYLLSLFRLNTLKDTEPELTPYEIFISSFLPRVML